MALRARLRRRLASESRRLAGSLLELARRVDAPGEASSTPGGPPAHWLAVVRARAPQLLEGKGIGTAAPGTSTGTLPRSAPAADAVRHRGPRAVAGADRAAAGPSPDALGAADDAEIDGRGAPAEAPVAAAPRRAWRRLRATVPRRRGREATRSRPAGTRATVPDPTRAAVPPAGDPFDAVVKPSSPPRPHDAPVVAPAHSTPRVPDPRARASDVDASAAAGHLGAASSGHTDRGGSAPQTGDLAPAPDRWPSVAPLPERPEGRTSRRAGRPRSGAPRAATSPPPTIGRDDDASPVGLVPSLPPPERAATPSTSDEPAATWEAWWPELPADELPLPATERAFGPERLARLQAEQLGR